jgi:hypothetical protein
MSMPFVKKCFVFAFLGVLFYFLLSYHIIIVGEGINFRLLKKSKYTLQYTIFSTKGKSDYQILAVDTLREDGIGNLLIEEGLMSEERQEAILNRLNTE